jgi:uncharacterized protein involved in oxidation of intracellular sulfur
MILGLIINTSDPEKAWNAFRLGVASVLAGHKVRVFLLGAGVEVENIQEGVFNVRAEMERFLDLGGEIMACGTCLKLRNQEGGICPISTMNDLVRLIETSDRVVVIG